jgi:hypothetical protein
MKKNLEKLGEFNGKIVKYIETENGILIIKPEELCRVYDCVNSNTTQTRYKVELSKTIAKKYDLQEFVCHVSKNKTAHRIANVINHFINLSENN